MTQNAALSIASQTMLFAAKIAAPILLSAMAVGLVISFFQSVTQIQEMTLTFVPKLLVIGLVIAFAGHWMLGQFTGFVHEVVGELPRLLKTG
ncbi:MAG: flagellar biosynthesis protein FliQ [Actinomycetota bacterium]|jgi:flagellar biosynthetic protein FliQ|nr:flagellar biosynthesis protein FliQ [Actinomycetota bacterium]